ncbi:MipA/OmpV family protein [Candidatus Deferrimicrobium sp.]|uniref:MipA/OmpV family protein n=1 Tax=Candidatus Deferrimicrobium sp. TaxID=3060586 RepID=UPI002EDA6E25
MMKTLSRIGGLILCAALFLAWTQQAAAGTVPQWELGAGVAGLMMPDYRGSDEVRLYLLPVPYVIYRLEWIKADRTGIRSTLLNRGEAELNLSLSATPPVRSENNRAREGMSDLKPMVELGPALDIHLWRSDSRRFKIDVRTPVRAAFTVESHPRNAGVSLSPTLNFDADGIGGRPWQLGMLAGPLFATRRQHRYFYGVSESDARPDRPAFDAHGGYAGLQFLVALSRRFEKAWFGAYARYDTLRGAVFEDSPLVRRNYYVSAGFAVAWIPLQSSRMVERDD